MEADRGHATRVFCSFTQIPGWVEWWISSQDHSRSTLENETTSSSSDMPKRLRADAGPVPDLHRCVMPFAGLGRGELCLLVRFADRLTYVRTYLEQRRE